MENKNKVTNISTVAIWLINFRSIVHKTTAVLNKHSWKSSSRENKYKLCWDRNVTYNFHEQAKKDILLETVQYVKKKVKKKVEVCTLTQTTTIEGK